MNGLDLNHNFIQDSSKLGLSDRLNFDLIFEYDQPCVIGVSGGPDSVYLLCQTVSYYVKQGRNLMNIHIAHIDYGFRKESIIVANCVELKSKGLSYHYFRYVGNEKEAQARTFRRKCFKDLSDQIGSNVILLGNHLDDRIETCLMRVMQGYGSYGLKVFSFATMMYSSSTLKIYRPLIYFQKKQILSALLFVGVTWDIDYTNHDPNYTIRNKLRSIISLNSDKPFYYDARDNFFMRLESQYRFPTTIHSISVPNWCKWEIICLTKCNDDELLAFCKSYVPHLSYKHFTRILSLESGQKVELGDGFVTNTYGDVFHLLPRNGIKTSFNMPKMIQKNSLQSVLKHKKIPRFLRENRPTINGLPVSEKRRLDQLNI